MLGGEQWKRCQSVTFARKINQAPNTCLVCGNTGQMIRKELCAETVLTLHAQRKIAKGVGSAGMMHAGNNARNKHAQMKSSHYTRNTFPRRYKKSNNLCVHNVYHISAMFVDRSSLDLHILLKCGIIGSITNDELCAKNVASLHAQERVAQIQRTHCMQKNFQRR